MSDERLKEIADHYGLDSQLSILQEECAELIQAVSKFRRVYDGSLSLLMEEMADVEIMLEQIKYLTNEKFKVSGLSIYDGVDRWKQQKIDRQIVRMEENE